MNIRHQKLLLRLARKTLENHFSGASFDLKEIPSEFTEKRGLFVTLHKDGELRGCIGNIQPFKSIYDGVKDNVLNAAFHDPRFSKLEEPELKDVEIEISILSLPESLNYSSPEDLLKKLTKTEGVVLEKDGRSSTFLPQVWESLPDKVQFLEQLSLKAGLDKNAWKTARIKMYFAEVFSE